MSPENHRKDSPPVEVRLYGEFRRYGRNAGVMGESICYVPVADGETIEDVVRRIGIDPANVSHLFLNAQYSALTRKVKGGDRLAIFPRDMALLYRQYFVKWE